MKAKRIGLSIFGRFLCDLASLREPQQPPEKQLSRAETRRRGEDGIEADEGCLQQRVL
jgi:hypothetical protein